MKNKIILTIIILSVIALIFSGCDGGNFVTPSIPDNVPVIESITPNFGPPGTELTIKGRNFGEVNYLLTNPYLYYNVTFGNSLVIGMSWSDTQIIVKAPSDYGTGIQNASMVSAILGFFVTGGITELLGYFLPELWELELDVGSEAWWKSWYKIAAAIGLPFVGVRPKEGEMDVTVTVETPAGSAEALFTYVVYPQICDICNLPIYPINIKMYTGSESYFDTELKNVGSGYDIYDGIWVGWCADSETAIETNEWYQGYIYCSYNPSNRYGIDWPKINWIINNKDSYSADYIQDAIWHFTNGLAPNGLAMAAEAHSNFCPQSGQKYITIIDVPGEQHTFIEIPVE
jgi:hypothetical protein